MKTYFDHEKLDVYRESIAFCGWVGELLGQISAKAAVKDQLDRASNSLPLNIAEGNGKFSKLIVLAFWKSLVVQRWSVLHASMCLRCESLLLLNGSFLPRKGSSES
jgi:hypothetical protein